MIDANTQFQEQRSCSIPEHRTMPVIFLRHSARMGSSDAGGGAGLRPGWRGAAAGAAGAVGPTAGAAGAAAAAAGGAAAEVLAAAREKGAGARVHEHAWPVVERRR